jgi:hypothetical protein
MKFSHGSVRSESGASMRRSLSYLKARMSFRHSGSPVSGEADALDRLDISIEGVHTSFIVADDVVDCAGLVLSRSRLSGEQAFQLFSLNSVLLTLHGACFSWCDESACVVLSSRVPDNLVRDEDDLFDFAVECVRLLDRSERMFTSKEPELALNEEHNSLNFVLGATRRVNSPSKPIGSI